MADFHAADLWVAVVPETSQVGPAMEKAGKEAKGKFGEGVKGIGKHIHDEFDQIGQKAKDAFGKAGKTAGEIFSSEIGKELTNTAAKEIGAALGEAVRDIPGVQRGVELFQQWGSAAKLATQGIQGVGDAMRNAKAGDFAGALDGVDRALRNAEPVAKLFGADISGWSDNVKKTLSPLDEVQSRTKDIRGSVHDFADTFKGMPGTIGKTATALGALVDGPLTAAVAAAMAIDHALHIDSNTFDPGQHGWGHVLFGKTWDWFGGGDPNTGLDKHLSPPAAPAGPPGVPFTPQSLFGGPGGSAPKSLNDLLFPGSAPPGGGTSTPNTNSPWANSPWFGKGRGGHSANWDAVAGPEAGGNWTIDHGEGPDVTGGLQIATQTWLANGGGAFAPKAYMATPEQQKTIADRVLATQGPGAWPVTSRDHPQWFKGGGSGGGAAMPSGGLPNVRGAHPQLAYALAAAKGMFPDLQLTAGRDDHPMDQGWHPRGQAIDIGGGTPQEQAQLSNWFLQFAPDIEELIHSGPGVTQNIKSGRLTPAIDMKGSVYNSGQAGYHGDHVHLAIKDEMAQAFEDALGGGGIQAPGLNGRGPGGKVPTGAEHDPLYVMPASGGAGGGGGSNPAQQLGQGLLSGIAQSLGIDGSVFGGKSPLDWGAVKLGGGLLNYGMGLMNSMAGPMGTPGLGAGGGGGLGGLAGLIPGAGAAISAAAGPGGGSFGMAQQGVGGNTVNHDQSITINNPVGDPYGWLQNTQWYQNSQRTTGILSGIPTGPGT